MIQILVAQDWPVLAAGSMVVAQTRIRGLVNSRLRWTPRAMIDRSAFARAGRSLFGNAMRTLPRIGLALRQVAP